MCVFVGAMLGLFAGRALPDHHRQDTSRDAVKLAGGVVATLSALVLGLLVASAKDAFTTKEQEIKTAAAKLILLDRAMANYGPDLAGARGELRQIVELVISSIWPPNDTRPSLRNVGEVGAKLEGIQRRILGLSPKTKAEEWYQSRSLELLADVMQARMLIIEQLSTAIHPVFLVVLILWLTVVFLGFGLISPHNATTGMALSVGALAVSAAILLILEMDRAPFSILISISSEPLRTALMHMGG